MIRLSTGLIQAILGTGSLKSVLTPFLIDVRDGPQPPSANNAPTGTLLVTYSVDHSGTGCEWGNPVAVVIDKAPGSTIQGLGLQTGDSGWFRIRLSGDLGTTNSTDLRLDGSVGTDMPLADIAVEVGTLMTLDSVAIGIGSVG